mmetsp:Transcript_13371/g.25528  ORF Transcript_13371/g.25528 Transcript_13371/m.25528 type:complete len:265 (+) Transcript_13371:113-907(+)|eukprot:CAMPEP_0197469630 /NCGR_PEP_ID=MMETSP1309-20131121/89_1 /TAXON_ID=464262 /ORGANISM="Genus nov. species nov., Strain RCC998" /LENGTH=264 /DNA_ID=CAMNT_0043005825 /DNA_START=100 /DNA_END=894 /DNA_ORIENTATION=+
MKTVVSSRNAAVAPRAKATRSRTLVSKTNGALARRVACRAEADPKQAMEEQMKRLQAQVSEGKIKAVNAAEVGNLIQNGWTLLDVRPPEEVQKGAVENAVEVPLFVIDDDTSPGGLLKQMSAFGMGGWWLGNKHMKLNTKFMGSVRKGIPTDASVIVGCQKGLRSLSACEQLAKSGYQKVAWVTGGFDSAEPGDLPVKEGQDIRFAGNGGLSDVVGWTDAHKKANKDQSVFDGPFGIVLKVAFAVIIIDGLTAVPTLSKLFGGE